MARIAALVVVVLAFPAVALGGVVVVSSGDDVWMFDHDSSRLLDIVDPGGGNTRGAVISADGRRAFVTAGAVVAAIDLRARMVSRSVAVATKVRSMAISPDGDRLYVARRSAVEVLDSGSLTSVGSIVLGAGDPTAIAVSPDGRRGVVVLDRSGVAVLDLPGLRALRRIRLAGASGVAFGPRGSIARIAATRPSGARLVSLDARRGRILGAIRLGTKSSGPVAITCDGRRAIVGAGRGSPTSTVVDLRARRVARRLFAGGLGPVAAIATSGSQIYLGGRGLGVSVFSQRTYRRQRSLILGEGQRGYGIAIQPGRCPR